MKCAVEDVLVFISGADRIPPTGFGKKITVKFVHDSAQTLATSSTCDIEIRLPTGHEDYDNFKKYMVLSFKGNDGFGGT